MFTVWDKPLIHGRDRQVGPASEREEAIIEDINSDLKEMVRDKELSQEFADFLQEHCAAFEPCHGSVFADPRTLFYYLQMAWQMNDGEDLKKIMEFCEKEFANTGFGK